MSAWVWFFILVGIIDILVLTLLVLRVCHEHGLI